MNMKQVINTYTHAVAVALLLLSGSGCKKFLDVVPDNVATIDNAFTVRNEAEKYLFTCYSYLPLDADYAQNPALMVGDELYMNPEWAELDKTPMQINMGFQNASNPLLYYWQYMYQAIRDCNIFIENIDKVPDMKEAEKARWKAEVVFLKAYYHWYLFRMYGPIPVVDKNMPISSSVDEVKIKRQSVDSVVNYITGQLDLAAAKLPAAILNKVDELGRITKPIALAIKARVLVTAASPLFNGNAEFSNIKSPHEEGPLFNPTYSAEKWQKAVTACKAAIEACEAQGIQLYHFNEPIVAVPDELKTQMDLRNSVTQKWNTELVWGGTRSNGDRELQRLCMPRLDPHFLENETNRGQLAPTLKMAELFYTNHGVPINEDISWNYAGRYEVTAAGGDKAMFLQPGYPTASLHLNRENRFYADLAFDGAQWFMANGLFSVQAKFGQAQAQKNRIGYSMTGYFNKKLVNWKYVIKENYQISVEEYSWPIVRLADLYLLYAEAQNELSGPGTDAYAYLNKVRDRAGLPTVQAAWSSFSNKPTKFTTKDGLREIIQQERAIELAFEGSRSWDLRRWKRSVEELNKPVYGWDIIQPDPVSYYRPKVLFQQTFQPREYLWPIKLNDILVNPNLVQNPGW
jgi:hypothetical protein